MTPTFEIALTALKGRDWARAMTAFAAAAQEAPQAAEPWIGLARVHRAHGRTVEAQACLAAALARDAENADALNNLAQILRGLNQTSDALGLLLRALQAKPDDLTIFLNAMSAFAELRRHEEAAALAQDWVLAHPQIAPARTALAESLLALRRLEQALDMCAQALAMDPYQSGARLVQAMALNGLGRHQEAVSMARLGFGLRGGDQKSRLCLSECLASAGQPDEALALAQLARVAKDDAVSQMAVARAAFFAQRWDLAWAAYEHRFGIAPWPAPRVPAPAWRGESVEGKTILLVGEQGIGDSMQFARYAWAIAARGGKAILHLQEPLAALFQRLPPAVQFAVNFNPQEIDYWAPLMSAPHLLGMPEPMAPPPGYLTVPKHRTRPAALAGPGFKVGLVWAGNPAHPNDRLRSMPLKALLPVLDTPGVLFFSLQKGAPAAALAELHLTDCITDLSDALPDWGHCSAALSGLDLLISIDSAPAHLAGALGRPVWMLAAQCPDWRWGLHGVATPWYPSMRLYRQTQPCDWSLPVARIKTDLAAVVRAHTARRA